MKDPYEELGINHNASDDEVKRAYRELSRKYHPDSNVNNPLAELAEEKYKNVQEAYRVIMDERKKGYSNSREYSGKEYGNDGYYNNNNNNQYNQPYGNQYGGNPYAGQNDFYGRRNQNPYNNYNACGSRYNTGSDANDAMNCCCDLWCADTCCEMMGGDLCSCF
ncbi:MAG: J domain-containing protein [Lachnospiraceae bacterium]|jgi:molecular chaperone DnaJ|nr:J domain-containing protein [Lachnospiraceae bacterium]MEE3460292.1 J domain-containing protein [Lachnospiraceae bacterium]